jgi:hypothetical protein
MTRQLLNRGTTANDGTGDTLRAATLKIEQNLTELYLKLGGDSTVLMPQVSFDSNHLVFDSATYEVRLGPPTPTSNQILTLPDHTGVLISDSATQTLTNKTLVTPYFKSLGPDSSAAIKIWDTDSSHTYDLVSSNIAASRTITLPPLTDSDEFTFNNHQQTLTNKELHAPVIENAKIGGVSGGGNFQDSNGNEYLEFARTAGAINHVKIQNNTNNNPPTISAVGDDNHIDLDIQSKGSGAIKLSTRLQLGYENFTTATGGSVNTNVPLTWFNLGSGITCGMGDLSNDDKGTIKYLINQNSGSAVITPTNLQNYSTITLLVNQSATCLWDGTEWIVLNVGGDSEGAILA